MPATLSLDVIEIANPCPADWEAMHGDSRVRFCDHCQLNVYNLSAMTRPQAERLLKEKEGHLCVRLYKRLDGTVITQDCGWSVKRAAKRMSRLAALACAAVIGGICWPMGFAGSRAVANDKPMNDNRIADKVIRALATPVNEGKEMKGDVAVAGTPMPVAQPPVCEPVQGGVPPRQMMGEAVMLTGKPAPATQPATQPTTQPADRPAKMGLVELRK